MATVESGDGDGGGNAASSKSSPERVCHGRDSGDPLDEWVVFRLVPIDAGWWMMMECRFPPAEKEESMRWFGYLFFVSIKFHRGECCTLYLDTLPLRHLLLTCNGCEASFSNVLEHHAQLFALVHCVCGT